MDQDTLAAGAIGAFLSIVAREILPRIGTAFTAWTGWQNTREGQIAAQAKEGPEMVNATLKEQVKEAKEQIDTLNEKVDVLTTAHHQCEVNQARLLLKVEFLEARNVELQIAVEQLKNPTEK